MRDIIIKKINEHLLYCGFSEQTSLSCAGEGWQFFQKQVCNSRDPSNDACDHAGEQAKIRQPKVKYKSPKTKSKPRAKKPQDAFNFD